MSNDNPFDPWFVAKSMYAKMDVIWLGGEWLVWAGTHWRTESHAMMRQAIVPFVCDVGQSPNPSSVKAVEFNLQLLAARPFERFPHWQESPIAANLISAKNGLVDLETGEVHQHTPNFVNRAFLDYDYDPDADEPVEFLKFLNSIWKDDPECIEALQRMFGYLLTPDTSMQKMFQLMGPPRSGKGTIGDVIAEMLGRQNIAAPSLHGLTNNFALQPAIDKLVLSVSEARLDGRGVNKFAITDTVLKITGEDHFTIDRKYKDAWQGVLSARLVIQTNDPLELPDDSGALLSRLIVLPMRRSFVGKEDLGLKQRLRNERGAILKWAIEGWRLLREEGGTIRQPKSGAAIIESTKAAASPISSFVDEVCILDPDSYVLKDDLYLVYRGWCRSNGSVPVSKAKLTSRLQHHYSVRAAKGAWIDKKRGLREPRRYIGIKLKPGIEFSGLVDVSSNEGFAERNSIQIKIPF